MTQALRWPAGAATGVGSLPGDDPRAACRFVFDELPDLPYLPELPGRGPGATMTGRGIALLADVHADVQPSGWRLVARAGVDERRARDLLARDLDALEEVAEGWAGALKVQVVGPWTLASTLELPRGESTLADAGAVRDVTEALVEGVAVHLSEVRRRVPLAALLLQVDEPALPSVLAGHVPTASGFGRLRAVDETDAVDALRTVIAVAEGVTALPVVHCCAPSPPIGLFRRAGARALSLDATAFTGRDDDALGEAVEAGVGLWLGLVPALGPGAAPTVRTVAEPARALWRRLGFPGERLATDVVVTPTCGLAGASLGWAHTATRLSRQVGKALAESPEEVDR